MGQKSNPAEREADRLTEDDIAQASLGGTRGSNDLQAATPKVRYASRGRLRSGSYRLAGDASYPRPAVTAVSK